MCVCERACIEEEGESDNARVNSMTLHIPSVSFDRSLSSRSFPLSLGLSFLSFDCRSRSTPRLTLKASSERPVVFGSYFCYGFSLSVPTWLSKFSNFVFCLERVSVFDFSYKS